MLYGSTKDMTYRHPPVRLNDEAMPFHPAATHSTDAPSLLNRRTRSFIIANERTETPSLKHKSVARPPFHRPMRPGDAKQADLRPWVLA
jgi:hypothetical protein